MPAPRGDKWETDIEARIRKVEQRQPFTNTPIRPQPNKVVQSDDFDGDILNLDPGTKGWALSTQNAAFGTIILRNGIVGNDALTQPVVPAVSRASASNFALTVAWAELAGQTLTVPTLATTLLCTVSGRMYAVNPRTSGGADGTGTDALFVSVQLGSQASQATPTGISGSSGFATTNCSESFIVTGLTPGSTIRLSVYGSSGYQSLAAQADNYASFAATLVWLR